MKNEVDNYHMFLDWRAREIVEVLEKLIVAKYRLKYTASWSSCRT